MILRYPSTKTLSSHEKDLLWKFRFSLTKDKKAVTKFLKAVDFSNPAEAAQATQTLLPLWVEIDVEDALELLGASFENEKVRGFAVSQLKKASDDVTLASFLSLPPSSLMKRNVSNGSKIRKKEVTRRDCT